MRRRTTGCYCNLSTLGTASFKAARVECPSAQFAFESIQTVSSQRPSRTSSMQEAYGFHVKDFATFL